MFARLVSYWVYGGAMAGVLLLLLAPFLVPHVSLPLLATYLHLPAYMLHQLEEHDADRFRLSFNRTLGKGFEVLSPRDVFIANVPGVWLVITASLYLADRVSLGWALIAVYLVLVNAIAHLGQGVRFRSYNPGLGSAVLVFLPLGGWTMGLVMQSGSVAVFHHLVAAGLAVLIHAVILVHVRLKLRRLSAA